MQFGMSYQRKKLNVQKLKKLEKANNFNIKWNYPWGLGALDGKHCVTQAFGNSGSLFYNYKKTFSVILLALADANYKFLYVDIGSPGMNNDAGVMLNSSLQNAMTYDTLNMPKSSLRGVDYHILGDDAFGHTKRLVKLYPSRGLTPSQRIFNLRFSRERRVVENSFGIMSAKFRILRSPILQKYENACATIKAVCVLHNFLLINQDIIIADSNIRNNTNAETFGNPIASNVGNRAGTLDARRQRDVMADYFFSGEGQLDFQWEQAFGTSRL